MLVGGVPGNSAEEAFRTLAPILGDLAVGFTDREFGERRFWIYFVVVNTWAKHGRGHPRAPYLDSRTWFRKTEMRS